MKNRILVLITFFVTSLLNAQTTAVTDANFEQALISLGYDSGTPDGLITNSNISGVKNLDVSNKGISSLKGIEAFTSLEILNCNTNKLSSLDLGMNINLFSLACIENKLTQLDLSSNTKIKSVSCWTNNISSLSIASDSFKRLECNHNGMTALDITGSPNLEYLDCRSNKIDILDLSNQPNISTLNCEFNNISKLDLSNKTSLSYIRCGANPIKILDLTASNKLNYVEFYFFPFDSSNSKLEAILLKNGKTDAFVNFYIENNPNLKYICVDPIQAEYDTIQSKVAGWGNPACLVGSYCAYKPGSSNYYNIKGVVRYDSTGNGCNSTSPIIKNFKIKHQSTIVEISSTLADSYSVFGLAGQHTITPILSNPSLFTVTPDSAVVNFPDSTSPYYQDFCIKPMGKVANLCVNVFATTPARPGFDATYRVCYSNVGNTTLNGKLELSIADSLMSIISALPNYTSKVGKKITWNFSNLLPFENRCITLTVKLNKPTDSPAVTAADTLDFDLFGTINSQKDTQPLNNRFILRNPVVNAYDPNDKTCTEGNDLHHSRIGDYLHYVIRFENTGNGNAVNVVVNDRIDMNVFDISSLELVDASHNCQMKYNEADGSIDFVFSNIQLPFDDANNDGYLCFRIKTKNTLQVNDKVSNKASIYFDYNSPIITNTEITKFSIDGFTHIEKATKEQLAVQAFPNPVGDMLNIVSEAKISSILLFDLNGRIIKTLVNPGKQIKLNDLDKGTYIMVIKANSKTKAIKISKE